MINVSQYANMTGRSIWQVFQREGIAATVGQCKQGPHTLTYGVTIHDATKQALTKALALDKAIEAAIGDEPVRLQMVRGTLLVQVPSPVAAVVNGTRLRGRGLAVPVGVTTLRSVRGVDFEAEPHMLLVAPTRKGKTTAVRCILYHLAKQNRPEAVRFIVTTFKPQDWDGFDALAHTDALIVDPQESAAMLRWLLAEVYRRSRERVTAPRLFMVLDDLLNLISVQPDVGGTLAEIASLGAAAGIHLIIGTQRAGQRGTGDAAVAANITTRLVLGVANATDAAQYTGQGKSGAEKLGRYKGDALLVQDGEIVRLAVGYVRPGDFADLAAGAPVDRDRPWLSSVRTGAPVQRQADLADDGADDGDLSTGAPVQFPLPKRTPTPTEAAAIADVYRAQGSLTKTVAVVYGSKNALTMQLVKDAIEQEAGS